MPKGIAIVGLNGSGKTTLGRGLAERLGYYRMDVEDYYFPKSDVPYAVARTREEVERLMLADIKEHGDFVLSAVCADFAAIEPFYELIVYLEAPKEERMERIRQRSVDKFGSRVLPGGDMYEQEENFFAFAAKRTPDKIEKWIKTVACPVLRIDSRKPTEELVRCVICFLIGEKSCKRRKEIPF
ncbi:MAG: AAA family ATPase [Clostridia bacterium]|nr:AAA family ATPase [Clostridia bacterium]